MCNREEPLLSVHCWAAIPDGGCGTVQTLTSLSHPFPEGKSKQRERRRRELSTKSRNLGQA